MSEDVPDGLPLEAVERMDGRETKVGWGVRGLRQVEERGRAGIFRNVLVRGTLLKHKRFGAVHSLEFVDALSPTVVKDLALGDDVLVC